MANLYEIIDMLSPRSTEALLLLLEADQAMTGVPEGWTEQERHAASVELKQYGLIQKEVTIVAEWELTVDGQRAAQMYLASKSNGRHRQDGVQAWLLREIHEDKDYSEETLLGTEVEGRLVTQVELRDAWEELEEMEATARQKGWGNVTISAQLTRKGRAALFSGISPRQYFQTNSHYQVQSSADYSFNNSNFINHSNVGAVAAGQHLQQTEVSQGATHSGVSTEDLTGLSELLEAAKFTQDKSDELRGLIEEAKGILAQKSSATTFWRDLLGRILSTAALEAAAPGASLFVQAVAALLDKFK